MIDPLEKGLFDIPDYESIKDEVLPPLPPPMSPYQEENEENPFENGGEEEEVSKLPEVPKRKAVKRPQPKLDSQRLTSERGLPALRTLFDNVRFRGKGHEAEDLRVLMQRMENWAHRLYPKLQFEDFIEKVEGLGAKKDVQTCLKRIRLDMPLLHEDFMGREDEAPVDRVPDDAFEAEMSGFPDDFPLHSTPAPASSQAVSLSEEQRRRIELNKQQALERRLARMQTMQQNQGGSQTEGGSQVLGEPSTSAASATEEEELDLQEEGLHGEGGASSKESSDMSTSKHKISRPDSPLFDAEADSPGPGIGLTNGIEDSSD